MFSRVAAFSDQSFDRVFDDVPWCQYRFIFSCDEHTRTPLVVQTAMRNFW